jgi:hypothetical protein
MRSNIIFLPTRKYSAFSLTFRFSDQNLWFSYISSECYMPLRFHPPWFDHLNNIWGRLQLWSFSLCSLLQPPVTSSLLGPKIFSSGHCSQTSSIHVLPLVWETNFNVHIKQEKFQATFWNMKSGKRSSHSTIYIGDHKFHLVSSYPQSSVFYEHPTYLPTYLPTTVHRIKPIQAACQKYNHTHMNVLRRQHRRFYTVR